MTRRTDRSASEVTNGVVLGCLSRDGVSIMFMNNAHLGKPHATATNTSPSMTLNALWDGIRGHCSGRMGS
jgi:hypothetical protein